jgi:hypothetical protein
MPVFSSTYKYNWTGTKTGWEYELYIYGDIQGVPNEYQLPPGSVEVKSLKFEYDKYPTGKPSAASMSIVFHLDELEGMDPSIFGMLLNPYREITPQGFAFTLKAGTIFELYVNYKGNQVSDFGKQLLYRGINRSQYKWKLQHKAQTVEVETEDYNMAIFDSDVLDYLGYFASVGTGAASEEHSSILEYAYNSNPLSGFNYGIGHYDQRYTFALHNLLGLENGIEYYAGIAKSLLTSGTGMTGHPMQWPSFYAYEQSYDGTNAIGDVLTKATIFFISSIIAAGDEGIIGGLLDPYGRDKMSLKARYNSLWDFLGEYAENFWHKLIFKPDAVLCLGMYGSAAGYDPVMIDLYKLNDVEFPDEHLAVDTVTASCYEFKTDDIFKDFEKWDVKESGSQNGLEFPVPIVFNSTPTLCKYSGELGIGFGDDTKLGMKGPFITKYNFKPHVLSFYYIDAPAILASGVSKPFRIHDYVKFWTGYGWSDNLAHGGFSSFNPQTWSKDKPTEMLTALTLNQNLAKLSAGGLYDMLNKPGLFTMNVDVDFNEVTWFDANMKPGFVWWMPELEFQFDANQVFSYAGVQSSRWYMVSSDLDFEKEVAKVKLIVRP